MSGPKDSSWSIARTRYLAMRRARSARRNNQVNEINAELEECWKIVNQLLNTHGQFAESVADRVENWVYDVRNSLNSDLRDAWRGLNGIKKYLDNQARRLEENSRKAEERQARAAHQAEIREQKKNQVFNEANIRLNEVKNTLLSLGEELGEAGADLFSKPNQWLLEAEAVVASDPGSVRNRVEGIEKYLQEKQTEISTLRQRRIDQEKVDRTISSLESVREDCKEILNPGIEQRIELFTESIKTNPNNPQTLKQVETFRSQLAAEMEKYEEQQDNLKYIEEVFSGALGGTPSSGDEGSSVIAGTIAGVPITVSIDKKSNNIRLDTPDDGSCRAGIEALVAELENAQINLGPIRVLNSGETINNKVANVQQNRSHSA